MAGRRVDILSRVNERTATTREVTVDQAAELHGSGAILIDVRTDDEWQRSRIPGATHISLGELPRHAGELDHDAELLIYCRSGNRSGMAAEALSSAGFNAHNVAGGIIAWAEAGHEIEPAGAPVD